MNEFQRKLSAALAAQHKHKRRRRGKRTTGIGRVDGPGMMRRLPRQDGDGGTLNA